MIEAILSGNARIAGVQYEQPFIARGKETLLLGVPRPAEGYYILQLSGSMRIEGKLNQA